MSSEKKFKEIYTNCMRELYANSIGLDGKPGDWDNLLATAEKNDEGKLIIPFMDYYLPREKFDAIYNKHCKIKGLSPFVLKSLSFHIYLGASPTSHNDGRFNE